MIILYIILPLALVFAAGAVAAFAWTVRSGQLDDVDTPPRRILFDDEHAAGAHGPGGRAGFAQVVAPGAIDAGTHRE